MGIDGSFIGECGFSYAANVHIFPLGMCLYRNYCVDFVEVENEAWVIKKL